METLRPTNPLLDLNPAEHLDTGLSLEQQTEFFSAALAGYVETSSPFIKRSGENLHQFEQILAYQDWLLKCDLESMGISISDTSRRDLLNAFEYHKHKETTDFVLSDRAAPINHKTLADAWAKGMIQFGKALHEITKNQTLAPGTLDSPVFCYQGEELTKHESHKLCNNAAARMALSSITGYKFSERVLNEQTNKIYGPERWSNLKEPRIAPIEFYASVFKSEHFKSICDKKITLLDIEAASLGDINELAVRIKSKRPAARIFCFASIGTDLAGTFYADRTHRVALINANGEYVECHDPATGVAKSNLLLPRKMFDVRWALGYNRAMLFIESPGLQPDLRPVE